MAEKKDSKENKEPKEKKVDFVFDSKKIPTDSGCYLFYGEKDELLYVGKAKHLRKRVSSYFQKNTKSPKTSLMVSKIRRIETRIVHSEMESLLLENNLIKEFRPKFNILLRDDKSFLYLRITNEDFPRLEITRRMVRDGAFYVGPKTSAKSFRKTIAFCQKVFQVRDCKLQMKNPPQPPFDKGGGVERPDNASLPQVISNPEKRKLPCLDFHVKKCSGPCSGDISQEAYLKNVEAMKKFLRGHTREVLTNLKEKMLAFAADKKFEAAAKIRDLMVSIEASTEKQTVQFLRDFDADFIHFWRSGKSVFFVRVVFRSGKFLDQNEVEFRAPETAEEGEILEQFVTQFYEKVDEVPSEIFVPLEMSQAEVLQQMLEKSGGRSVRILCPQKGDKKKVLDLAAKNAKNFGEKSQIEKMSAAENFANALPNLAKVLGLKSPPRRIEGYDISHFSGKFTGASMVVFSDGKAQKSEYRKFNIKSLPDGKVDDFASMKEVLGRRFLALQKEIADHADHLKSLEEDLSVLEESLKKAEKDSEKVKEIEMARDEVAQKIKKLPPVKMPDLVVLDGGKGQISSVMDLFASGEITAPEGFDPLSQIISLAKREETIFRPKEFGDKAAATDGILLDFNDPALKLLQNLRDEAHRFAITANRSARSKQAQKSVLDEISGIGPSTKKKLMKTFETVRNIRGASDEKLLEVVSQKQLESLRKQL